MNTTAHDVFTAKALDRHYVADPVSILTTFASFWTEIDTDQTTLVYLATTIAEIINRMHRPKLVSGIDAENGKALFVAIAHSAWNKRPHGRHINEGRFARLIAVDPTDWDIVPLLVEVMHAAILAGNKVSPQSVYQFLWEKALAATGLGDPLQPKKFPTPFKFTFYENLPASQDEMQRLTS